jgi:hypothetical protein
MSDGAQGEIRSVQDLLEVLESTATSGLRWYRGHVDQQWPLVPSIARRREWLEAEISMIKRFKKDAYPRLRHMPNNEWDWIFLAQHNGVPTRLLDWSENPLVGLYFSVESDFGQDGERTDGRLWILRPTELNEKVFPDVHDVPMFGHDGVLGDYLPENIQLRPSMGTVAAIATRSFDRIIAQSGTFTVNHRSHDPLEIGNGESCIDKYLVPLARKEFIRNQLKAINVMAMTVYPDLATLGAYVKGLY